MADVLIQNNSEFIEQIKKFIVSNNIVGYTAGVCVALGTKEVIESAVSSVIVPGIILGLLMLDNKFLQAHLPKNVTLNVNDLVKKFFTWLMLIVMTYVFVKIAFERLLGVSSNKGGAAGETAPTASGITVALPTPTTTPNTPLHVYQGPQLSQTLEAQQIRLTQPQPQSVESFYGGNRITGSSL
jgi:large-conductance mechanosensitive channel